MSDHIEIRYTMSDGTGVNEGPLTADRAVVQHFDGGLAIVYLYRDGRIAETLSYRQADRIRRVIDPQPREDA